MGFFVASHESTKKSVRKNIRQRAVNVARISRIRTFVKKVETLVSNNDVAALPAAFSEAQRELMKGVTKGVLHKGNAARKISRLARKIKNLSATN